MEPLTNELIMIELIKKIKNKKRGFIKNDEFIKKQKRRYAS
jgi:hypothetical protein